MEKATLKDLVVELALAKGLSKKDAAEFYDNLLENLKKALNEKGEVAIHTFGVFSLKTTKPRTIKSPLVNGGAPYVTKESKRVSFKPSTTLKKSINE
jgi:nucleoid DNA-binding protein